MVAFATSSNLSPLEANEMSVTIDLQYSRRFRKAKTHSYWGERDGLFLGHHSQRLLPMYWHFFEDGDIVEFKDPTSGRLCQRTVKVVKSWHHEPDCDGYVVDCESIKAYVRVGRKKTRIVDAPTLRLIRK
jgi:hypothetical protein